MSPWVERIAVLAVGGVLSGLGVGGIASTEVHSLEEALEAEQEQVQLCMHALTNHLAAVHRN